jgi:stress response protein YsnF
MEKQKAEYEQNMNEMKLQWETTLRERQEKLAVAQEEIEVIPAVACDHQTYAHEHDREHTSSSSHLKTISEKLGRNSARLIGRQ